MLTPKKFQRTKENFVCENCHQEIIGNGYTNHCPHCLWSKHVDVNPGDRLSLCQGLMEPINIELKQGNYFILHRCLKCGYEKINKTAEDDDFETILALVKKNLKFSIVDFKFRFNC